MRFDGHRGGVAVQRHRVQGTTSVPRVPGTLRTRQGDLELTAITRPRLRGEFHTLTVAAVTRLCGEAGAITFDAPADAASAYAFRAGPSVPARRLVNGRDARRQH